MKGKLNFKKIFIAFLCLTPVWALGSAFAVMVYVDRSDTLYRAEAKLGDQNVPITVMTGKRVLVPGYLFGSRELSMRDGQVVYRLTFATRGRPLINSYVAATPNETVLYREIFPN